jgi:hypothetical protein
MAGDYKIFTKSRIVVAIIILLVLIAGFFLYRYFVSNKINSYLIENKYYGFRLQTPKNWIAEEKTSYSEDNIAQTLTKCGGDKTSAYGIGAFKFESQKYPDNFIELSSFPEGFTNGAILSVEINCVPENLRNDTTKGLTDNLQIAGEKAFQGVLSWDGFGAIKHISFFHNDFQYNINEYVYIAPSDKNNSDKLRANYSAIFDKIISSFKFVK